MPAFPHAPTHLCVQSHPRHAGAGGHTQGLTSVFGMGMSVTLAVYSPANRGVLQGFVPPCVCSYNLNRAVKTRLGAVWGLAESLTALTFGRVHPGLTSWGILSRPYGTGRGGNVDPGLTSWATLSRPCGTDRDTP